MQEQWNRNQQPFSGQLPYNMNPSLLTQTQQAPMHPNSGFTSNNQGMSI